MKPWDSVKVILIESSGRVKPWDSVKVMVIESNGRVKHLDIDIQLFPINYPPNASPLQLNLPCQNSNFILYPLSFTLQKSFPSHPIALPQHQ